MRKPSLLVIFLTVFIDLVGFGIVLPLLPRYSEKFGAQGFMIGLIISSFSVMQLFFAPWWGRLSDRIGRRPVLLISNAGSAVSYALFAAAAWPGLSGPAALSILLGSRVFAGLCGANISVASAYIADVTPRENRAKGMALIGVAFGLGFILGPALGALSAGWVGLHGPGCVAAALCAGNFLLACFILQESRRPGSEPTVARPKLAQWRHTLRQPKLGVLIGIYFLATFCFACFESTLPLLLGSPSFHPDDFRAPKALAAKLLQGADHLSVELRSRLSPAFVERLAAAPSRNTAALRREFFAEFNHLIRARAIPGGASWSNLPLREETRLLLAQQPTGESRVRLNRMLLEDAYPAEIVRQRLYFDERRIGYLFAYCGLVSTLIQGGVIGRLVTRFGEQKLIFGSLVAVAVSLAVMPYSPDLNLSAAVGWAASLPGTSGGAIRLLLELAGLLFALALFSAGSGVNRAPTMALISIYSPASEQGAALGVAQSAGTLARIVGPVFATSLYALYPHSPYLIGAALALVAGALAWRHLCQPAPAAPGAVSRAQG
jgi:MFS family permease